MTFRALKKFAAPLKSDKGIALLMVIWVLIILMVIVLSFSYMSKTESSLALAFKERTEKKLAAEAGIERGITEIFYRNAYKNQNIIAKEKEAWKTDGTRYSDKLGDMSYTVSILDESGKVDINAVSEVILKNLLLNTGIKDEDADTIVDSVMDWKDPDDLVRLHGAESDYYMSLPAPYKAKNAPFDAVEELLLVKGMTREILYGTSGKKGLIDFLTVNSKNALINVNAAAREVLTAIPGITPEIADGIISFRENNRISNMAEAGVPAQGMQYLNVNEGNIFTILAAGHKGDEKKGYAVKATIIVEGINKYRYLYYKSPVQIN